MVGDWVEEDSEEACWVEGVETEALQLGYNQEENLDHQQDPYNTHQDQQRVPRPASQQPPQHNLNMQKNRLVAHHS